MSCFSSKSIRQRFPGHISKGLSLAYVPTEFLGFVTSLALPGPPTASAPHKHYTRKSTNILFLVLN